jgi:hypothetical protein
MEIPLKIILYIVAILALIIWILQACGADTTIL